MSLRERIEQDLISTQKARDVVRLETLRFLLSAVKYKEVDNRARRGSSHAERDTKQQLTDDQTLDVLTQQVKTHKESMEAFQKGNRPDLVAKEEAQLKILQNYLPTQISEFEVRERVTKKLGELKSSGQKVDFGTLMKLVMPDLKGRVDGAIVKNIVEEVLNKK